jgi:hypothetical protein
MRQRVSPDCQGQSFGGDRFGYATRRSLMIGKWACLYGLLTAD